jgi:alpha-tubulin suppressor-like RCC1 family protein
MYRLAYALLAAGLVACGESASPALTTVTLDPGSATLAAGDTLTFTATVRDASGNVVAGAQVAWGVSDTAVATVTQAGFVTARAPGTALVGAASGVGNAQAVVTVSSGSPAAVLVAPDNAIVDSGATRRFVARVTDVMGNALPGQPVTWTTSSAGVLAITQDGLASGLATGNALVIASAGTVADTAAVTVVPFALRAASVDSLYTCATSVGLTGYCWGRRDAGVLGNGLVGGSQPSPGPISSDSALVAITSGGGHACGLTQSGAVLCWGSNDWGQLGDPNGYTLVHATPSLVQSQLRFTQITAGLEHTCGRVATGYVYCWGLNDLSQLGGQADTTPHPVPLLVTSFPLLASISAGAHHTCGLTADGIAYCWGDGQGGALGTGDTAVVATPTLVAGSLLFASLSAGADYTCGATKDGLLFCWGHGTAGQLGTEDTLDLVPTRVHQTDGLTFQSIAAGGTHTCALTTAGDAYCWGQGTYGQLGTGVAPFSTDVPVAVTGGITFVALSVGLSSEHTCGVTPDTVTYCWGYSLYGQVGDGTTTNRPAPTRVVGQ